MPRGRPKKTSLKTYELLKTTERKPIRPLERQRMRPWLMDLLERKGCHQLGWINKRLGTFRVSWKHAAGQTFDPAADATLFELWARHTGKYFTGDVPDPKKWKANFRCALHSLQDVHEDKSLGVKKGNNAFRVYKFLDEKQTKKPAVKKEKVESTDDDDESDNEFEVLRNIGTRSRPKKIAQDGLDSDGSEMGKSPSHDDSNHSDWEMGEPRQQDYEAEKSPLPKFEELYQLSMFQPVSSQSTSSSMQTSQSSSSDLEYSKQLDDEEIVEEEEDWLENMTMREYNYNESFWASVMDTVDVQEVVVFSDDNVLLGDNLDGPNVIVLQEQRFSNDLEYTSIANM